MRKRQQTLIPWKPTCNGSVHAQLSGDATTNAGGLVLREALDTSGVIDAMTSHLNDSRDPLRVRHSLALQLRITVLQRAMGWSDLTDTQVLRHDPLWRLACSDARGLTPLETAHPSQATLSRLITCLSRPDNLDTVHEPALFMAQSISQNIPEKNHRLRCSKRLMLNSPSG